MTKCAQVEVTVPDCVQYMLVNVRDRELSNATPKIFSSSVVVIVLPVSTGNDRINHHGLFIKLMDRNIPVNLLSLLENWFSSGVTCVKWGLLCQDLLIYHAGSAGKTTLAMRFISTAL